MKNSKSGGAVKTPCPVTRQEFRSKAKVLHLTITDPETKASQTLILTPREFSSKSLGWGLSDKVTLQCGDIAVRCQAGCNFTIVNSADTPESR